ncbi:male sterility protein-domain-containing protein [Polychytrium aggregatum]|uniref:male sterility protein-domain-containing protein n=1 Tax=Polychytrium aggregatum TaxID=110093 RepID=UPI0022FE26E5|nr:male sterility protein-domain-containing protein [Polychytrium aggregatum]KAI9205243.1 male sterility protein-domain-containing protein [Polychytrium aggregatum]
MPEERRPSETWSPIDPASPEVISPGSLFPVDQFGQWMHPLEAVVKFAREEPDILAIFTLENGSAERYTYLQLWERAYSIAQGLKTLPGWDDEGHDVVAIYCEPEAHWVFYTYAVWILGKRVINFALNWPSAIRNEIAQRVGIRYMLCHMVRPGRIPNVEVVDAGQYPLAETVPVPSLEVCAPLQELIFYLTTSGTTGVPKTYLASHVVCASIRPEWGVLYGKFGVFLAPSFSVSTVFTILTPTFKGSLWFPKPAYTPADRAEMVIRLLDSGMDVLQGTPSFLKLVFNRADAMRANLSWPAVRRIAPSAELVTISLIKHARMFCPNATIQCGYGSSEAALLSAVGTCIIRSSDPIPSRIVYTIRNPAVRCLLFDEHGNTLDTTNVKTGILVYTTENSDRIRNHPDFLNANPNDKLSSFGFLADGSPRVCTMDEVEIVGTRKIVVFGRFGQKVRINGTYIDLNAFENILTAAISHMISDCAFTITSGQQIVLLYVLRKGTPMHFTSRQIYDAADTIFSLQSPVLFPIHNCIELQAMPFNDSGKRDLKKLKKIAENADQYALAVSYPALEDDGAYQSKIAIKVSRIGSVILDVDVLDGRDYYLAGVGFDFMSASRLALVIKEEFDAGLAPLILLSHGMTPRSIAAIISDIQSNKSLTCTSLDLLEEAARLDDPSVTAKNLPRFVFPTSPRGIVLTGATGFLGIFLLFELAAKFPSARIVCLVRAASEHAALERLQQTARSLVLASHNATDPKYNIWDRVDAVPGDLALDMWGLSVARWNQIAQDTDVIVHAGAVINWIQSYEELKGPNVLSTTTALRLATTHHLKPLHYISTIGAVPTAKNSNELLEERVYSAWNISGGYLQTKWLSEQLISMARAKGVPATVIRPSMITGDSLYGVCKSDDYIWRYIKGFIHLGAAPCHGSTVTMSFDPVDHVARVTTEIAASEQALSLFVFHISDPENSAINEPTMFKAVRDLGWEIFFETREHLKDALAHSLAAQENALFPLVHMVMSMSFRIDNPHTRAIYPIRCISSALQAEICLRYLLSIGFLPVPGKASRTIR